MTTLKLPAPCARLVESAFAFCLMGVTGCSLYESAGRKYLEQNAYQFAGVSAQANQQGCQPEGNQPASGDGEWVRLNSGSIDAQAYAREGNGYDVRIFALESQAGFNCDFHFESSDEMTKKTPSAVDLTLSELQKAE